ncbi:BolA family protein [Pseudoalteromonas spongiae]|uniref:BolA family protein n=1 Tax=Pseudoalteromonas spongiae TaxID=298657 RepID=UPI000C2D0D0A|nr:BolA/IbaG family iron-sulfur metabolism protein [Pseudoalteromonas spongiae]
MLMLEQIESKLKNAFSCEHLEVINESHMHSRGTESHFKVIVVSNDFEGKRLLQCHRMINEVLADELANHIHALAIHTYTQSQWQNADIPNSPKCLGGSKFDQ